MDFYTINEVAEKLKVTRAAVYKWMAAGQLAYVIVGKHRRVTSEALNAFIRAGGGVDSGGKIDPNTSDSIRTPGHAASALVAA